MKILVLGGAGYIGTHACVALAERGHEVAVVDNLVAGSPEALRRASRIVGRELPLHRLDIRETDLLCRLLEGVDAVVHFAALKAVGESSLQPLKYFDNNISGTVSLLSAMQRVGVRRLVFSSSATVYGAFAQVPVDEGSALGVTNPYGRTKLVAEQMIGDVCAADPSFTSICLRYFNPVGAHASGVIGEDPRGAPNNLVPFIAQVAVGRRQSVQVFGGDYPTHDGTGIRDYIHVMDLARAHVSAVEATENLVGAAAVNLGTGRGYSVLEVIRTFEQVSGRTIPYEIVGRRPGDIAELWADPSLALRLLNWRAELDLHRMCADSWRWQSRNPMGYATTEFARNVRAHMAIG